MSSCAHERGIVAAVRSGRWSETLRDHAETCLACAETAFVARAMMADARALEDDHTPLRDPRIVWIRSRLEVRQRYSRRFASLVGWMHRALVLGLVAVGAFFGRGLLPVLERVVPKAPAVDLPLLVAGPAAVLVLTFVVAGLMALWTERSVEHRS